MTGTPYSAVRLRPTLRTTGLVGIVFAALGPLSLVFIVLSATFAQVGGATTIATVAASVIMLCFAVGYGRAAAQLANSGGFAAFITRGLGRTAGLVAAAIMSLGYGTFMIGAIGLAGVFSSMFLERTFGWQTPWWMWASIAIAACCIASAVPIRFASCVLTAVMAGELVTIMTFDVAVFATNGIDIRALSPALLTPAAGAVAVAIAAVGFIGVETTALFSEELRGSKRHTLTAIVTAVLLAAAVTIATGLAVTTAVGVENTQGAAQDSDLFVMDIAERHLGSPMMATIAWLVVLSLIGVVVAVHLASVRGVFALARARVLPTQLTVVVGNRPRAAARVQLLLSAIPAFAIGVVGGDPLTALVTPFASLGSMAILTLQALAATAVVVYFRMLRDTRWLTTLALPLIGAIGLWTIAIVMWFHFDVLTGSAAPEVMWLRWLIPIAGAVGLAFAWWMRTERATDWEEVDQNLDFARWDAED